MLGVSLRLMSRDPEEQSAHRGIILGSTIFSFITTMAETITTFKPCIIVHGGAGNISISRREQVLCAVKEAVKIGYCVLLEVRLTARLLYPEAVSSF